MKLTNPSPSAPCSVMIQLSSLLILFQLVITFQSKGQNDYERQHCHKYGFYFSAALHLSEKLFHFGHFRVLWFFVHVIGSLSFGRCSNIQTNPFVTHSTYPISDIGFSCKYTHSTRFKMKKKLAILKRGREGE